jgi:hypothetical protein
MSTTPKVSTSSSASGKTRVYKIVILGEGGVGKSGMSITLFYIRIFYISEIARVSMVFVFKKIYICKALEKCVKILIN